MTGLKWFDASAAMTLTGIAVSASGGCAWFIGADWSSYEPGGGWGGAAGSAGSSVGPGTGTDGTGGSAQGSGGAGGDGGAVGGGNGGGSGGGGGAGGGTGGAGETGGGGGDAACRAIEEKCSENAPLRCVDGRWESGEACVGQTCVEGTCAGECGPEDVRCSVNRPQRCDERGAWEDAEPCGAAAPVCGGGTCVTPRSCVGLAETCGPDGNESCCATTVVPGGTFNRSNDAAYPATVSGFLLDRFEMTVGRFRKFVETYPGSKPAAGAGAHPKIAGSGWDAGWDSKLPADAAALKAAVKCNSTYQTWTDEEAANERLPMNCLSWYEAFAFCAWDGGRLATEAEWNYAAAGGGEQREFPWSNPANATTINSTYAVYDCMGDGVIPRSCAFSDIQLVGSRSPKGDGKWGQADLSGNLREWVLDWYKNPYDSMCNDCANLTSASNRVVRGGSFGNEAGSYLRSSARISYDPSNRYDFVAARCARTP